MEAICYIKKSRFTLDYFRTVLTLWATHRCLSCYQPTMMLSSVPGGPWWNYSMWKYIFIFHTIGNGNGDRVYRMYFPVCWFFIKRESGEHVSLARSADSAEDKNRGLTICIVEGYIGDGMVTVRGEAKLRINMHSCNLIMNNWRVMNYWIIKLLDKTYFIPRPFLHQNVNCTQGNLCTSTDWFKVYTYYDK